MGAGIIFSGRNIFPTVGQTNMINMLTMPITAIAGFAAAMYDGISCSISSGLPSADTPNATGNCFRMMITPIAASIPCTADVGEKLTKYPRSEHPEQYLQYRSCHSNGQCRLIGRLIRCCPLTVKEAVTGEVLDASDGNDDQSSRRAFDREF